jgi:hypothetical protein
MDDVAIDLETTTAIRPCYRTGQPRLWLVREQTGPVCYPEGSPPGPSPAAVGDQPETVEDWKRVHARIAELGAARASHERDLCRWLLAAERLGVHARAGYASLREYAARVVGLSGRQTEERLRVGRALAELPGLDDALAGGKLCFSVVRELSRVAQPDTEAEWLDWASAKTTRQVEQAVASRRLGDRPRDPGDPSRRRHRLAFEVRAETLALFRDLQATVRSDLGGEVDDDTLLYEIARRALGGPTEAGRASYQVAVTRCPDCGQASIDAAGQSHPVDQAVLDMAACDGQELGAVDGAGGGEACGCDHDDHPSRPHVRAEAVTPAPRRRARQAIPPVVRRAVLRRDGHRCTVPGCTNHRFLDVHHLDPLAEGGSHDPDRLISLCGAHHRHTHLGALGIAGNATGGFTFSHADGTPYGEPLRPAAVDLAEQAVGTLRHLGFPQRRARALVDTVVQAGAPDTLEQFVSAALRAS